MLDQKAIYVTIKLPGVYPAVKVCFNTQVIDIRTVLPDSIKTGHLVNGIT